MQPRKAQKIDLSTEYPCPCRRKGHLLPITLTDAFGCDRCQQIFVVEENGKVLEQLSTGYPSKRSWRWTGNRWIDTRTKFKKFYIPLTLGVFTIVFLMIVWWLHTLPWDILLKVVILPLAVLLSLFAVIFWLAYRR
ncbi:MAG: hypothetical protein WA865_22475 [Spirulinaceae cyanobacterium]